MYRCSIITIIIIKITTRYCLDGHDDIVKLLINVGQVDVNDTNEVSHTIVTYEFFPFTCDV